MKEAWDKNVKGSTFASGATGIRQSLCLSQATSKEKENEEKKQISAGLR